MLKPNTCLFEAQILVPMKFGIYMYCDRDYIGESQTPLQSFIEGLWCLKPLSIIGHVRFVGGGNRGFSRKTKRS
jgi:hypothetical protein